MVKLTSFIGGETGKWKVTSMRTLVGEPLEQVTCLDIREPLNASFQWMIKCTPSNMRYTTKQEDTLLKSKQPTLDRVEATYAALIPIKKSDQWWDLAQDERRKIIEDQSGHIKTGITYLPQIARKLYHCRDLGEQFDFLTWFEFAPENKKYFDDLVGILRETEEWRYVIREIDIRLIRRNSH